MMDIGQGRMGALEEQQRLKEEPATDAAIQSEAIIAEIGVLERERDRISSRLKRKSCQVLTRFNFQDLEDTHITTIDLYTRLNSRIEDWADLLEIDEDGDTIYPNLGVFGIRYSPDGQELSRKTRIIEDILSSSQEVMMAFLMSLPVREQLILSQEAKSSFLKDPEALRSHYRNQDQEEPEDEGDGGDNDNSGENPGLGQQDFQEQEDDPDFVPSPP